MQALEVNTIWIFLVIPVWTLVAIRSEGGNLFSPVFVN